MDIPSGSYRPLHSPQSSSSHSGEFLSKSLSSMSTSAMHRTPADWALSSSHSSNSDAELRPTLPPKPPSLSLQKVVSQPQGGKTASDPSIALQQSHQPGSLSSTNSSADLEGQYIPMYPFRQQKKAKTMDHRVPLAERKRGGDSSKPAVSHLHHYHSELQIGTSTTPPGIKRVSQPSKNRSKSFHVSDLRVNQKNIAKVLDGESATLPQIVRVTRGQTHVDCHTDTSKAREVLRTGDFILAHFKQHRFIVQAITANGSRIVIPLNSYMKFVLAPKGIAQVSQMTLYSHGLYPNVESLSKKEQLPVVVRTISTHDSQVENESIDKDRILFPKAIARKRDIVSMQLAAHDMEGKEFCLREDCLAGFSTKVNDTWMFVSEIVENFTLPQNVFVATHQLLAASEVGGNRDLVSDSVSNIKSQLITLTNLQQQNYLIGTKNSSTDVVLEIPLDLDVEVERLSVNDNALSGMNLLQTSQDIHKDLQDIPGQLVFSAELSEREQDFQEELFKATCDMDDLIELRNMAGGRSLRSRAKVTSPEREVLLESHSEQLQQSARHRANTPELSGMSDKKKRPSRPKSGHFDIEVIRTPSQDSLNESVSSPDCRKLSDQSDTLTAMRRDLSQMKEQHAQMKQSIESFEKRLKALEKENKKKNKK